MNQFTLHDRLTERFAELSENILFFSGPTFILYALSQ